MNLKGESLVFVGIAVVSVLILGGILLLGSGPSSDTSGDVLVKENSQIKGAPDAKITLVEFADLQCPACRAALPVIKGVEGEYKNDIRLVFRHFPLPSHKNARLAAESAEAAGEQGKFWEYHDILYSRQSSWSESKDARKSFEGYAKELKLDIDRFNKALDEHKFLGKIEADAADGRTAGVNSTPTFFLNGERMTGVPNPDDLKQRIDVILSSDSSG